MKVLGYTWAGVRTPDLTATTIFFAKTLGLPPTLERSDVVVFELPTGQLFELMGPGCRFYDVTERPVLGFQVEDVHAARAELESLGVEFLTGIDGEAPEFWTYFRGPDGNTYELWQTDRTFQSPRTE